MRMLVIGGCSGLQRVDCLGGAGGGDAQIERAGLRIFHLHTAQVVPAHLRGVETGAGGAVGCHILHAGYAAEGGLNGSFGNHPAVGTGVDRTGHLDVDARGEVHRMIVAGGHIVGVGQGDGAGGGACLHAVACGALGAVGVVGAGDVAVEVQHGFGISVPGGAGAVLAGSGPGTYAEVAAQGYHKVVGREFTLGVAHG